MTASQLEEGLIEEEHNVGTLSAEELRAALRSKPCWLRLWAVIEIKMLKAVQDPKRIKENIKGQMSSVALVGALVTSSQFTSFSNSQFISHDNLFDLILGIVRLLSLGAGLGATVFAVLLMNLLNAVPDHNTHRWTLDKLYLIPFPVCSLLASFFFWGVNVVLMAGLIYGNTLRYIAIGGTLTGSLVVFTFGVLVGREKGCSCA